VPTEQGLVFEWDQAKSERNLAEHGFDFGYAARIFEGDLLEWEDTRRDYGEPRSVAIGEIDEEVYVVVYTPREGSQHDLRRGGSEMSTVRRSQAEIRRTGGRVDSRRVRATTDKDIAKWIAEDQDTASELPPDVRPQVLFTPPLPDVRRLRARLGITQAEFAKRFGLSRRTVEQWEQGRTVPDRPARILLAVIERDPRVVERVVVGRRKS
jgi:DNA-binding transcriptional regulator YiaG/uncharacterized DUF497 family protein